MTNAVSRHALQQFLTAEFPQIGMTVETVDDDAVLIRQAIDHQHLRPGRTVSGPTMMAVADCAAYVALLARIGIVPLAVTTSLNIHFLSKPSPDRAICAKATLLKLGQRLAVSEVAIHFEGTPGLVAHAVVTYAIPAQQRR